MSRGLWFQSGAVLGASGSDYSLIQLIMKEAWEGSLGREPGVEVGKRVTLERCREAGFTQWMAGGHTTQRMPHEAGRSHEES